MGRRKKNIDEKIVEEKPKVKKQPHVTQRARDHQDWIAMCEYVKKEIMGYPESMKFPRFMVDRLEGLRKGQFKATNKIQSVVEYDSKVILYTFQICKPKILDWFARNNGNFKNEEHKFNSAMMFVEKEINDVMIRLSQVQKSKEKTETTNIEHVNNEAATYTKKSKDTKLSELNELW